MYLQHFGLKELPFSIAPDPQYLFMSEQHREALAHLLYGINTHGGFVLLTGEVGTGKTTVCRCLLEQLPDNVNIAFIINPKMTVEELLATMCDELQILYPYGCASIKMFVDLINAFLLDAHSQGEKTVLLIDEAQNLRPDVLEQIRLLTNLETDQQKLLQIIMIGQPELRDMLSRPDMSQLSQRITARYHIGPLSREDVTAYVNHRLSVAGANHTIFLESVMKKLHHLSKGIPRLINVICDRALLGAYVHGKLRVDKKLLVRAAAEVMGKSGSWQRKKLKWVTAGLVFAIGGTAITSAFYFQPRPLLFSGENRVFEREEKLSSLTDAHSPYQPSGQPTERTEETEYQSLSHERDIPYPLQRHDNAYPFISIEDLRCIEKEENLKNLSMMNQSAMLNYFDYARECSAGKLMHSR